MSYFVFFVCYLYLSGNGSITSGGEDRANLSAIVYLLLCGFCSLRFSLPLCALDGLHYFIVALPESSKNINILIYIIRNILSFQFTQLLNIMRYGRVKESQVFRYPLIRL